jgi:hypothetical protein
VERTLWYCGQTRVTRVIGRYFANWATFKSGWRFFKEKIRPKNGDFSGDFSVCQKLPKIYLIKATILIQKAMCQTYLKKTFSQF